MHGSASSLITIAGFILLREALGSRSPVKVELQCVDGPSLDGVEFPAVCSICLTPTENLYNFNANYLDKSQAKEREEQKTVKAIRYCDDCNKRVDRWGLASIIIFGLGVLVCVGPVILVAIANLSGAGIPLENAAMGIVFWVLLVGAIVLGIHSAVVRAFSLREPAVTLYFTRESADRPVLARFTFDCQEYGRLFKEANASRNARYL